MNRYSPMTVLEPLSVTNVGVLLMYCDSCCVREDCRRSVGDPFSECWLSALYIYELVSSSQLGILIDSVISRPARKDYLHGCKTR